MELSKVSRPGSTFYLLACLSFNLFRRALICCFCFLVNFSVLSGVEAARVANLDLSTAQRLMLPDLTEPLFVGDLSDIFDSLETPRVFGVSLIVFYFAILKLWLGSLACFKVDARKMVAEPGVPTTGDESSFFSDDTRALWKALPGDLLLILVGDAGETAPRPERSGGDPEPFFSRMASGFSPSVNVFCLMLSARTRRKSVEKSPVRWILEASPLFYAASNFLSWFSSP